MLKQGMTLIELLLAMAILGIILGSMYNILHHSLTVWQLGETRTEVSQNGRIAIERMIKELRHAGGIYTAGAAEVKFWADTNWNGVEDDTDWNEEMDPGETVTYKLLWDADKESYNLIREVNTAAPVSEEFANYIQAEGDFNLSYYYWDEAAEQVLTVVELADIDLIEIKLRVKKTLFDEDEEYLIDLRGLACLQNR